MANTIKQKRGTGSNPSASDLEVGEIAVRTDNGHLFTKNDSGTVIEHADIGVLTANTIVGRRVSNGSPQELTASQVRTIINVENGATADQTAAEILSLLSDQNISTSGNLQGDDLTTTGVQLASSSALGRYVRMYGSSGTGQWDIYGNGANLRFTDNQSSGKVVIDTELQSANFTISSANPSISFSENDQDPDFKILCNAGQFRLQNATASANLFTASATALTSVINHDFSAGIDVTGNITVTGTVDGVDVATVGTRLAGLVSGSSGVLLNGVTATTQAQTDNSTKVSTTAYVRTAISNAGFLTSVSTSDIDDNAVSTAKMANMPTDRIMGREASGTGDPQYLTATEARSILNVEDGATADQTKADIDALNIDAATLDGVDSGSFVRSDASDSLSGQYNFTDDGNNDLINFTGAATSDNRGIAFNSRTALSADQNDGWLRLNNASEFANGVYTPLAIRADGGFEVDGNTVIDSSGDIVASKVPTLNQDTTGTAAVATTVTVSDESSDTSCNVLFATGGSGNVAAKSGSNLTFNSSTGLLVASGFSGDGSALTGLNGSQVTSGTIPAARLPSTITGDKTFSGNVSFGDNNITNVGEISLDTIKGDADDNTNINFAGSDTINIKPAGTTRLAINTSGVTVTGTLNAGTVKIGNQLIEKAEVIFAKLSADPDIDVDDGNVFFFGVGETANATPNITSTASNINSIMAVGDIMTVTVIAVSTGSGYYQDVTIDGSQPSFQRWLDDDEPTSASGNGDFEVYTYTILKTANNLFSILANRSVFK